MPQQRHLPSALGAKHVMAVRELFGAEVSKAMTTTRRVRTQATCSPGAKVSLQAWSPGERVMWSACSAARANRELWGEVRSNVSSKDIAMLLRTPFQVYISFLMILRPILGLPYPMLMKPLRVIVPCTLFLERMVLSGDVDNTLWG